MKKTGVIVALFVFALAACKNESEETKELTAAEKRAMDSTSRANQKKLVDSLKKRNPLLILPPDSEYTGEYVDKYASGIIKFKGFFRFGQKHGTWLSFYPTGVIWSEMNYDKGLRHGQNIAYYLEGGKRYEGFYKNDQQDSAWIYYDSTGNKLSRIIYKNDRVIKEEKFK